MNMLDQRFIAADLVQIVTTADGGAVLLDLQTDRFLGIDQMGRLMWTLLMSGYTPQEVMSLIAERYAIESEKILQDDILRFLQQMVSHHLLLPAQTPLQADTVHRSRMSWSACVSIHAHVLDCLAQMLCTFHVCEWLEAWVVLWWVDTFLRHGKLIDLARRLAALPTGCRVTADDPHIRRLAHLVQRAAAWHPFKAVCLHQNLALGFLLRRRALHADLVIGVSTFPFFAHAWLRSGSEALHWKPGLGPAASLQRLYELSIIFCTEWFSGGSGRGGRP